MSDLRTYPREWPAIAVAVKHEAAWLCVRCGHPGAYSLPTWRWAAWLNGCNQDPGCAMDELAARSRLLFLRGCRTLHVDTARGRVWVPCALLPCEASCRHERAPVKQRALTVHHLDGDKHNLRWWNLVALCQVCHLQIQGKVKLGQAYMHEHSAWFVPYVAGYYASTVLGEELTRAETSRRLGEIMRAGQPWLYAEEETAH